MHDNSCRGEGSLHQQRDYMNHSNENLLLVLLGYRKLTQEGNISDVTNKCFHDDGAGK